MAELTIADVLTHYGGNVDVPEFGWRLVRCPFHDDSRASAGVNLGENAFSCHACPIHGDPIGVIMKVEHLNFKDACEWSAKVLGKSGREIPQSISRSGKPRKTRSRKWREILE